MAKGNDESGKAKAGENVDRAFWTIGPGGVGQSLLSHHLHAVFASLHAFVDTTVFYSDDEMRKQAEHLVNKLVMTCQEAVEGSRHGMRQDIYKKTASADPLAARLPYRCPLVGRQQLCL